VHRLTWGPFALAAVLAVGLATGSLVRRTLFDDSRTIEADVQVTTTCREFAEAFVEYPLVNAGDRVTGFDLQSCDHRPDLAGASPQRDSTPRLSAERFDRVDFVYGTCEIEPGRESCPVPVQISVFPPCGPKLTSWVERVPVRGAVALVKPDGSIRIETPSFLVTIFATGIGFEQRVSNALAIANLLVPANDLATNLRTSLAANTPASPVCEAALSTDYPVLAVDLDARQDGIQRIAPSTGSPCARHQQLCPSAHLAFRPEPSGLDRASVASRTPNHRPLKAGWWTSNFAVWRRG
jgi:hypothetical protein